MMSGHSRILPLRLVTFPKIAGLLNIAHIVQVLAPVLAVARSSQKLYVTADMSCFKGPVPLVLNRRFFSRILFSG